jgi:hypothetical protein
LGGRRRACWLICFCVRREGVVVGFKLKGLHAARNGGGCC